MKSQISLNNIHCVIGVSSAMKHFLYLDTDIVNSIIAQSQKGLVTQQTTEEEQAKTKTSSNTEEFVGEATGGGKIWKFAQAEAKLSGQVEISHGKETNSSTKDVIEKIMHDAAFDIAYEFLKPNIVDSGDQQFDNEGTCLELKRTFDFVDFDYLQSLFAKDGVIDFIKQNEAEKIENIAEQATENLNREQLRKKGSAVKQEIRKAIQLSNKQYDTIADIIKVMKSLFPYSRMLISNDGYLIPFDDQYFRINPQSLGFKYGGEITCVGIVTNIIGEDTNPNDKKNIFATLQFTVNEVLRAILPTKQKNLAVVHPIAVYYEK